MWVQIVVMIVALIVSYVMRPKPTVPKPAALEDFNVPTAEDGRECSMVFGTNWIDDPNVLFYGDLRTTPIKVKGGKKGFTPVFTDTYEKADQGHEECSCRSE
ncbi:hypothetical protein U5F73_18470, partial [Stenotrophomonas pavanii]